MAPDYLPPRSVPIGPRAGRLAVSLRMAALLVAALFPVPAHSASTSSAASDAMSLYIAIISEAAERFTIPERWITAVIDVESHGDPRAVSPKGALGLMQLLPKTFTSLRLRYSLGADPFDPHDNIMAGTAFLREMYDRFGASGFLAAYNAGPKRYQDHLTTGRPLPLETGAYVVQLNLRLGASLPASASVDAAQDDQWPASALFVTHLKPASDDGAAVFVSASPSRANRSTLTNTEPLIPPRGALFVSVSSKRTTP